MLNQPPVTPPPSTPDRRPGQRGDTTETYVRQAQDRANRGSSPAPTSDAGSSEPAAQGGGLMALLSRLWPFKRGA